MKKDKALTKGIKKGMSDKEKKDKLIENLMKWMKSNKREIDNIPHKDFKKVIAGTFKIPKKKLN